MNALKTPFLGGLRSQPTSKTASPAALLPVTTGLVSPDPLQLSDPLAAALASTASAAAAAAGPTALVPPAANTRGRVKTLSSLAGFKRPASPSPGPVTSTQPSQTLIQDGSYLQALGLKLNDAVSKALAQPVVAAGVVDAVVDGKGPLPAGRGKNVGSLIASELRATDGNPNLQRAFVRVLQRSLSVLLTNLNTHLLPLAASSAFSAPFVILNPASPFNAVQTHALALASFAGELLETFDTLGLGVGPEASSSTASASSVNGRSTAAHGDGLRPIREGLESIVNKVATPLFAQVRKELQPLLDALEHPAPSLSPPLRPTHAGKNLAAAPPMHPSVGTISQAMPAFSKVLGRLASLSPIVHGALASCLIALFWRAMSSLAHRPTVVPATPPSVTASLPSSTSGLGTASKKLFGGSTPPGTPSATRFLMKLPSSRPPSPPSPSISDPLELEAKKIYDLLVALPRPATGDALEAVAEGQEDFEAFLALLRTRGDPALVPADVPTLVALPFVLRASGVLVSVPELIQLGSAEYHNRCLSGFGRAAECGPLIARTVADVLSVGDGAETRAPLLAWLRQRAA